MALAAGAVWWFVVRDDTNAATTAEATTTPIRQLAEVTTGTFSSAVSAEGTVAAAESEDLSFGSSGTVTAVNVAVGDTVTPGQVLASIDSAELEASLAEAQAAHAEAVAQLEEDQDDDASDEQIAADEARLAVAYDSMEAAYIALGGGTDLVATVAGTVTALDLEVGDELGAGGVDGTDRTGSDSPSGNSRREPRTERIRHPERAQVSIVSTGSYEIELSVDSSEIESIEIGQPVSITEAVSSSNTITFGPGNFPGGGALPGGVVQMAGGPAIAVDATDGDAADAADDATIDAGPVIATDAAAATGTVVAVDEIADASSGVATYSVTVAFSDDTSTFFIGTSVVVDITTSERSDVVQVPTQAVTNGSDGSTVEVALEGTTDGATETRSVTTGESSGMMIEITDGLEPGEQVIIEIDVPTDFGGGRDGQTGPPAGAFPAVANGQPVLTDTATAED